MFLRASTRRKNGKLHRYWSIVENKRVSRGRVVQRHVLYLGEISALQQESWQESIEVFEEGASRPKTAPLIEEPAAEDTVVAVDPEHGTKETVRIRLAAMELRRPRQWGACWLACHLYEELELDGFFAERLPPSRKGTRWDLILQTLCAYRLIAPGSEWRLHRQWFESSAMADLLGEDFSLVEIHKLYECHDRLLKHKAALFSHLEERWKDLFNAQFEILLYDLTSTYFESDPPEDDEDKVLQILINLVSNAQRACDDAGGTDKRITVRVTHADARMRVQVTNNGIGIPREDLVSIFNHGFTTKKDGHGFGLHSAANAAKELGGSLTVHSAGPGHGATFTLEQPCPAQKEAA